MTSHITAGEGGQAGQCVAYGLWIPAGQIVAGVNVDTTLMLFAAVSACCLQQGRVLAVS